jgi:hypothetical protein
MDTKLPDLVNLMEAQGLALKKSGRGYITNCPFHDDRNPSFNVDPDKGFYKCFGCGKAGDAIKRAMHKRALELKTPVLGITGTGGAGKSSLTDELIRRLRLDQGDRLHVAVISIDPSRRKSGGALLGDRIRMNAIAPWSDGPRVFMRSLATRATGSEISAALPDVLAACKVAGFDLIIVETSGIGQGDAAIVPLVDVPMYVNPLVSLLSRLPYCRPL